jgi:hypothetical protein
MKALESLLPTSQCYTLGMGRREIYKERMAELGLSQADVVRRIVEIRQRRGEDVEFQQIQSAIGRALKEPDRSSMLMNDEIVEALQGSTIVKWIGIKVAGRQTKI